MLIRTACGVSQLEVVLMVRRLFVVVAMAITMLWLPSVAEATPFSVITNGGFESGLTGWTLVDEAGGSGGFYLQSGTGSPLNGFSVSAPTGGSFAAMTDMVGPGSHVIYQDFVVPMNLTQATLFFQYYANNMSGTWCSASTLSYGESCNQAVRVDLVDPSVDSDPFTVNPAAILGGGSTSQNTNGYEISSADITSLIQGYGGQTLRLRFHEVDNQLFFNFGIDDVSITGDAELSAVPEPGTMALMATGIALIGVVARRRRSA